MLRKRNNSIKEAQFRVDVNISLGKDNTDDRGVRTEIKNLNSLRLVRTAVNNEIDRQYEILRAGGTVLNETRTVDRDGLVACFSILLKIVFTSFFLPFETVK